MPSQLTYDLARRELRMKLSCGLSVFASLAFLFTFNAGAQTGAGSPPQLTLEQIAKMPVRALYVQTMKMLTSTSGWVSTGSQILMTTDNGAHWKDISPPNPNHDGFASVFFHDADTGWVLFSHDIQEGENPTPDSPENQQLLYVSATADGGTTWTKENLPVWEGQHGLNGAGIITFADRLHGWMSLTEARSTLFASSSTLSTSDGGKTWNRANSGIDGNVEGILAVTAKDIWMVGRSSEDGSQLGVSHDGGETFQGVSLPAPKEFPSYEYPEYSLPTFTDSLNGYEAVTYSDSEVSKSVAAMYATQDGGRTWKLDRILSNLAEEETVKSTVAGSTWILAFAPQGSQPALVKLAPGGMATAATHKGSGAFTCSDLSFLTPDEGWMNCSGNLSSTIDGGAPWINIAPRPRNGAPKTAPVTPSHTFPIRTKAIR